MAWNHNVHYHGVVMRAIPPGCQRALDVGCGRGALARRLARYCGEVVGIDVHDEAIAFARAARPLEPNVTFVHGEFLAQPFADGSFDFVVAVASLHHLCLRDALERFRSVLRPGGVLAVVGLYRDQTVTDRIIGAIAFPISWAIRLLGGEAEVGAPIQEPAESLREIRAECESLLPGGVFRRRLFFRYSFVWRKPGF